MNKALDFEKNRFMVKFEKTDDIVKDTCGIIESSRDIAYKAVNTALVQRNWLIGCRISEEILKGEERALRSLIYIASIPFINVFLRFSTQ